MRLIASVCLFSVALSCASHPAPSAVAADPSQSVIPPQPRQSPPVTMPYEMQGKPCTSGRAVVEAIVETTGRVSRVRLLRQSGAEAFDTACLANAYRWEFKPGEKNGSPIETTASIVCRLECR